MQVTETSKQENKKEVRFMNAYWYLLLWQALLAGSAFWIRPSGWLWCLIIALIIIILESIISLYARQEGLQAFATPFQSAKYQKDTRLLMIQTAFTIALTANLLVAFAANTSWNLFWLDLGGSVLFGLLIALALKKQRG